MKDLRKTAIMAAVILMACNDRENKKDIEGKLPSLPELNKMEWLLGSWENHSEEGDAAEIWKKENDSTYSGVSYFIVGKDTVSSEKISLEQRGDEVFYIPTVNDQNAGKPVKFKLTSSENDQLVFENPSHDFPQKITYRKFSKDSLMAEISGKLNGKESAQQFPLTRKK
jgi:hypothetical protein